jgi:hypothetical protein
MKRLAHRGQLILELAICPWQEQKESDIEAGFPVNFSSENTSKIPQFFIPAKMSRGIQQCEYHVNKVPLQLQECVGVCCFDFG